VRCQILLPFPEPEFIDRSILPSATGETWRARYFEVKDRLEYPIRIKAGRTRFITAAICSKV
jgi:hypothetical protein